MSACPYCFSKETRRSRGHWYERWRKLITRKRPYRCNTCRRRFWIIPVARPFIESSAHHEHHDHPDA